ncbi:GDSL-type esterase/lipase family protein [Pedobacter helvus]|uniref:GDSL-type esterase/lipase family protein n=1 Tax=Pedobacter helvus TaxID=2563444 RepID=A0ABW9JRS8_9SPHI|nr:GDSL-type esterase/lipase family protein [Pedobacter ureilyticus]
MMNINLFKSSVWVLLFFFLSVNSFAQINKFEPQVKGFVRQDSIKRPQDGMILLLGSSSFSRWKDVKSYFPDYYLLNRSFGGSVIPQLIYHAEDVIFRYKPVQILIYCGDNDIAVKTATPEEVAASYETLFNMIRKRLGEKVNITYVAIKPSPARKWNAPRVIATNQLIANFIKKKSNANFVDVYQKMVDEKGEPLPDIFISDNLHMNEKGYEIWKEALTPVLVKNKN